MVELFGLKTRKKNKEAKAKEEQETKERIREEKGKDPEEPANVILAPGDQSWLEALISPDGPAPPLPPRPELSWEESSVIRRSGENSPAESADEEGPADKKDGETKEKMKKKKKRWSIFPSSKKDGHLAPEPVSPGEEVKEERDMSRLLRALNLASDDDPQKPDVSTLVRRFFLIFQDLATGVPTAYNDLIRLIDDRDSFLDRAFEKLPSGLQKFVMQLPEKVTAKIGPDVLAAAAKAQGAEIAAEAGLKEAAMSLLTVKGLKEMVTKPDALALMLKSIYEALKLRFPAFLGANLLWSIALFLLMLVLWYCHKRGKEERLKKEGAEKGDETPNKGPVVEEVSDDESADGPREPARLEGPDPVPLITGPDDAGEGSSHKGATGKSEPGSEPSK